MSTLEFFPLTSHRLRFHCVAETRLSLGGLRAGSNLRGALVNVMQRAACTGDPTDKAHVAVCPVCWLVAADDRPGVERRGYVISPPLGVADSLEPDSGFDFHISLFGDAARYLPYFVLAVPEAGRNGVGPGRGRFTLRSIYAEHPLLEDWVVLNEGDNLVRPPNTPINHADIENAASAFFTGLEVKRLRMRMDFLTPMRLIFEERLLKSPDFGTLFKQLLLRLDELAIQHAGGSKRPTEEIQKLWNASNNVRLVESQTRWEDIQSGSSRTGQPTWISGMIGSAWYSASTDAWRQVLPWLIWGQVAQVGKDTAKGNGVYRLYFEG